MTGRMEQEDAMSERNTRPHENRDGDAVTDRRGFLRLAGLGTLAGGAAVVTGGETVAGEPLEEGRAGGYRLTAHVRQAYDTARF
ncbi:secreted protein [Breoghania corrubedonensis]|uniref:Secreted protein n=1 Tax=Breoghania corrubedonensis TaxID=665038 RepID=A0A2T5VAR0_9HYPH|nr:hypothetical protein [Breoghania corrubedonensis]PTW60835.1 secreted protein [Breoghania corrubedonensis]